MYKIILTALLAFVTITSISAAEHHGFQVLSHKDRLYFYIKVDKMLGGAPGLPSQFAHAYIMTPDGRKVKGPKIDVTAPISAFRIVIHPPILLGNYTIVMENLTVGGAKVNYFSQNVVVKNSRNTKQSLVTISSISTLIPANPGDTIQGNFVPFHLFLED